MKKHFLLAFTCLFASTIVLGQTTSTVETPLSIGTSAPNASAMLDVQSTDKGILVPRMTTAQRNAIASPAVGLLVFDTNLNQFFFLKNAGATPVWESLEKQTLSTLGNAINLSNNGGTILVGSGLSLAGMSISAEDPSATNELQTLSIAGNDLSISGGNTVALPAATQWNTCTTENITFGTNTAGDNSVGIGTCPDNTARLLIKDTDNQNRTGIKINFTGQGTTRRGAHFRVENGSNTNDGIVLFSRGTNGATGIVDSVLSGSSTANAVGGQFVVMNGKENYGLKMVVDDNTANNPNAGKNVGIQVEVKNNTSNDDNSSSTTRDIALLAIAENKTVDYAGWFDGDIGVPEDIHFVDPSNFNAWSVAIDKILTLNGCGGNSDYNDLKFRYQGITKAVINNNDGSFCASSDRRLKENIAPLATTLPLALQLNPVTYHFISDPNKKTAIGFIAQEVEQLFPQAVNRVPDETLGEILTLNYDAFSVIAIKTIQEQQVQIEQQETRLDKLEQEMAALKALVQAMSR